MRVVLGRRAPRQPGLPAVAARRNRALTPARALLVVLLIAVAGGGSLALRDEGQHAASTAAGGPGAVMAPQDRARLEQGLASSDRSVLASVLAPAVAAAYAGTDGAALPAGSAVRIDASRFVAVGDEATVPMEVTGAEPGRWLLVLVRDPGGPWLSVGTRTP